MALNGGRKRAAPPPPHRTPANSWPDPSSRLWHSLGSTIPRQNAETRSGAAPAHRWRARRPALLLKKNRHGGRPLRDQTCEISNNLWVDLAQGGSSARAAPASRGRRGMVFVRDSLLVIVNELQ